ncbi:peptidoglycan/LPS O-acetylase OafA/YrhL [Streptomyces puniciscabiei]|uniref:Peptidoglycan/LPS O-acetylase OafA/YrhL n=1 Tax=Streptomyces puniciscabiei TaxID=164348 RepID=A0A542SXJ7_9ACTN|nr:acyltransferase [Streptomyces puniciscabiei]TQK79331.1 peptidoglycan/LPS O-acetylase OafA/YrhL [Streptomyces puniciscabiei]
MRAVQGIGGAPVAAPAADPAPSGPPPAPAGRRPRLDSLTGLRFFAALSVFVCHSSYLALPTFANHHTNVVFHQVANQFGGLGVAFFFVLSGFVLTWSSRTGDRLTHFYRRRFVKILPLYYVAGAAAVAVFWGTGTQVSDVVRYATLTQVWVPNPKHNFTVLPPGWSLAVEAVFYLVFPFVVGRFRTVRPRTAWTGLAVCVAGAFLMPVLAYDVLPAGHIKLISEPSVTGFQLWFAYVFPVGRLFDFFAGMFAALLVTSGRFPRVSLPWVLASFVPAYVVASYSPVLFGWRAPLIISCVLLIVAAAQRDVAGRPGVLSSRPLVALGNASFAFYLCHYLVLYTLNIKVLHGPFDSAAMVAFYLAAALAISLALAGLLYRYVEMPLVRRLGSVKGRR